MTFPSPPQFSKVSAMAQQCLSEATKTKHAGMQVDGGKALNIDDKFLLAKLTTDSKASDV